MEIHPVHNDADYRAALKETSKLMESDPELGTPEGDRLDVLATLVQAYESEHYPIAAPDPIEAIKFRVEQGGLTVKGASDPLSGTVESALNQRFADNSLIS